MKVTNSTFSAWGAGLRMALMLGAVMVLFFWRSFVPGWVLFSNDGPLGVQKNACVQFPGSILGVWFDTNILGSNGGGWPPSLSIFLRGLLGPFGYAKFIVPITLGIGAMCAWYFFRRRGLSALAALLAALAFALNSDFFSNACWGVGSQVMAFGMSFFALGLISANSPSTPRRVYWARYALAGLAIGMGVMEGADNGALFSVMIAGFIVYDALTQEGPMVSSLGRGIGRTAVIAFFAFFLAFQTIFALVSTQIQGIAGTEQDAQTKAEHWNWATQWSLPKKEALEVVVPGLFGYRMDTPQAQVDFESWFEGGNYWGRIGSDPALDDFFAHGSKGPRPSAGFSRFRGSAIYAGVPVVLVALWAALQALRRKNSVFSLPQRKFLWFWMAVAVICVLLAFGRFAPFYQFLYALPYFSTIRNPIKFMHLFSFALVVLFGYGVDGLWRRYLAVAADGGSGLAKACWAKASAFDRLWAVGCLLMLGVSLLAWLVYASNRQSLEHYLRLAEFDNEALARSIADFSICRVGWFVGSFALGSGLLVLIFSGVFAGRRAKWGGALLGLLLVADLWHANLPWVIYWDYAQKYATNPIIEQLRDRPYEHRVAFLPLRGPAGLELLDQMYRIEWAQHHFLFYNIQSLDIVQLPRMPADLAAFESALRYDGSADTIFRIVRRWQLTNTRYLLGAAGSLNTLNQQLDPVHRPFRIAAAFDIVPKPGIARPIRLEEFTAVSNPNGQYALFEFTGALPRARLYSDWQVPAQDPAAPSELASAGLSTNELSSLKQLGTNDFLTLRKLGSASFDPEKTVLLAAPVPAFASAPRPVESAGSVEYVSYAPKHIVLRSDAGGPSVLLLNDKYDPSWKVTVDGKAEPLLRCNFIMRGVYLPAGAHTIDMRFRPQMKPLYVSLAAIGFGVLLVGVLALDRRNDAPRRQPGSDQPS